MLGQDLSKIHLAAQLFSRSRNESLRDELLNFLSSFLPKTNDLPALAVGKRASCVLPANAHCKINTLAVSGHVLASPQTTRKKCSGSRSLNLGSSRQMTQHQTLLPRNQEEPKIFPTEESDVSFSLFISCSFSNLSAINRSSISAT